METVRLRFPFSVEGMEQEVRVEIPVERNSTYVSFPLAYDLKLSLEDAELRSKTHKGASTIYVFEFRNVDCALRWMKTPAVDVGYKNRSGDCRRLEEEMNSYMRKYEQAEKRAKKKRLVEDEDGFTHYE
ncbi:hypothetical protein PAPHI01_0243 [Pancytospora philotis]|nr:hypothetical protein PAPHI01_0243 [Pancytospora philotis]